MPSLFYASYHATPWLVQHSVAPFHASKHSTAYLPTNPGFGNYHPPYRHQMLFPAMPCDTFQQPACSPAYETAPCMAPAAPLMMDFSGTIVINGVSDNYLPPVLYSGLLGVSSRTSHSLDSEEPLSHCKPTNHILWSSEMTLRVFQRYLFSSVNVLKRLLAPMQSRGRHSQLPSQMLSRQGRSKESLMPCLSPLTCQEDLAGCSFLPSSNIWEENDLGNDRA